MDATVARIISESKALGTDETCILVYLMANSVHSQEQREKDERFKGKIFSRIDYDDICSRYNMLDCTVKRILKKFESIGWLKFDEDGIVLGEWTPDKKKYWYCSKQLGSMKEREPRRETATEQLRRLVNESKHKSVETKIKKLGFLERSKILTELKTARTTTPGMRILNTIKSLYIHKFNTSYKMAIDNVTGSPSFPKELGLLNRALQYANNNEEKLIEIINWVFQEWEDIKIKLGWLGNGPNASLFSTKAYFTKVLELKGEHYVKSLNIGQRFDEGAAKSAPDRGY